MPRKDPESLRLYRQQYAAAHREKLHAYRLAYSQQHRAQAIQESREYHEHHRDVSNRKKRDLYYAKRSQRLAQARRYREENRAAIRARDNAYSRANPERRAVHHNKRRARKAAALRNDFTLHAWRTMKDLLSHCCIYCNRRMDRLTMDHLTPLSHGGDHTLWNILPACQSCNSRKHNGSVLKPVQPFLLLP